MCWALGHFLFSYAQFHCPKSDKLETEVHLGVKSNGTHQLLAYADDV
jgi:hypothetical protein